ncbi:hypothetical protein BH23GEM9_BH23GEM9_09180 [soil metagenome]
MDIGILILIVFILAPLLEKLLGVGRPKNGQPQGRAPSGRRLPGQRGGQHMPGEPAQGEQPGSGWPGDEPERPFRSIPSADAEQDEAAAGMLPDDLWEILTGERRTPTPEQPARPGQASGQSSPRPAGPAPVATPRPRTAERRPTEAQSRESRHADRPPATHRERPAATQRDRPAATQRDRPPAPLRGRRLPEVTMRRAPSDSGLTRAPSRRPASAADDLVRDVQVHEAPLVVSYDTQSLDADERQARFYERRARLADAPTVLRVVRSTEYTFHGPDDLRRAIVMAEILGKPKALEE